MVNEIQSNLAATTLQSSASKAETPVKPVTIAISSGNQSANTAGNVDQAKLDETVSKLNDAVRSVQRDLHFRVDENSGKTVITVLDSLTEEVIRQIPSESVLSVAENIESLKGLLFSAET